MNLSHFEARIDLVIDPHQLLSGGEIIDTFSKIAMHSGDKEQGPRDKEIYKSRATSQRRKPLEQAPADT
jgi:hypothetical protein